MACYAAGDVEAWFDDLIQTNRFGLPTALLRRDRDLVLYLHPHLGRGSPSSLLAHPTLRCERYLDGYLDSKGLSWPSIKWTSDHLREIWKCEFYSRSQEPQLL